MNATYVQELSTKVTELIGYHLGEDHIHHIHADGSGWFYYIQDLRPGYPVLAMHYRGPLMLALPFADYGKLEAGDVTVDDYIADSHWNYGYMWGGGGLLSGAYWQPLEQKSGIHDTERISRYLRILSCRTHRASSGYGSTEGRCIDCELDETSCPFSPLNQTGAWENEVREPDGRRELFQAVRERIQSELGFERYDYMSHHDDRHEILLFPGLNPNTARIFLSAHLLNDLLYHPEVKHDWAEMAQQLHYTLAMPYHPEQRTELSADVADKRAFCLNFWGDKMLQEKPTDTNAMLDTHVDSGAITPCGQRILNVLGGFFKRARG